MSTASNPLAEAIAFAEGFGKPGSVPTLANNPGDLKAGDVGHGTTSGGITVFGSPSEGWAALLGQVDKMTGGGVALLLTRYVHRIGGTDIRQW
jgi:hypothetical protein